MNTKLLSLKMLQEADAEFSDAAGAPYALEDGDYRTVAHEQGEDRRWSRTDSYILEHIATGTFWSVDYEQGLTENCDCGGFADHVVSPDRTHCKATQVEKVETVTHVWRAVK